MIILSPIGDKLKFSCAYCGKTTEKASGHVNRARERGLRLFCNRKCAGLGRRKPRKSKAQRKAEKKAYDAEYRIKNHGMLKAKKAEYFRRTYDPKKAAIERNKRMAFHVEYCRRPSYKLWKREYDRRYRAKEYGDFAEAYHLTIDLNREIKSRSNDYEIRRQNETGNKAQTRKRQAGYQKRRSHHSTPYGI